MQFVMLIWKVFAKEGGKTQWRIVSVDDVVKDVIVLTLSMLDFFFLVFYTFAGAYFNSM